MDIIKELLKFERNSGITKFKYSFNDELIWPYFRIIIFYKAISLFNELEQPKIISPPQRYNILKKNLIKNPFLIRNKEILFFDGDEFNLKDSNDKRFNKISNYYIDFEKEKAAVIEYTCSVGHVSPMKYENKIFYHDYIDEIVETKYQLNKNKYNIKDLKTADLFIECMKNNLPIKFEVGIYEGIKKDILRFSVKIRYYYYYYYKLIKQVKPKIMFFHCGYYGGKFACCINIANKLGILTAEFQHGMIDDSTIVYKYDKKIKEDIKFKSYLPEYFLTWGDYWNKKVDIPNKIFTIGNAHMSQVISDIKYIKEEENTILFIADPKTREENIKLMKDFCENTYSNSYKIIFRLHPSYDKNNVELYKMELNKYKNIEVNIGGEVYKFIKKSKYVVSSGSTVLYEAIMFKKNIFIFKNSKNCNMKSDYLGSSFSTSSELIDLLKNKSISPREDYSSYYWNLEWKENYKRFKSKCLKVN